MATVSSKKKTKKKMKMNMKKKQHSLSDLKRLGEDLLTSRAHVNNIPILISFVSPSCSPRHALDSLLSLQSFFTPLLPQLPSSSSTTATTSSPSNPDRELIYRTWLRSKFDELVNSLIHVAVSDHSDHALREVVLDAIMDFVKVGNAGKFHSAIYHKLLHAIIVQSALVADDILLNLLATKYFNYLDVSFFTYISLEKLARTLERKEDSSGSADSEDKIQSKPSMDLSIHKMHNLLSLIPPLEASKEKVDRVMWNGLGTFTEKNSNKEPIDLENKQGTGNSNDKVLSSRNVAKKMKLKFTKAWISFLRLPLPLDVYKEVLVQLHKTVIPHLSNPIMLCDFLTRSYDIGGVVSVMALSSLYILMTQHGLEYPNFYNKLYALLEPSIFMAKHRSKFFELLDSCLKSSLLPAYLAAAFCKKLSRLALSVPPSGALVIIALVHNLLQRHPSINCLVHKEGGSGAVGETSEEEAAWSSESTKNCNAGRELVHEKPGIDHFKAEESDPKDTNAMRSSLWEIDTLRHHYCAPVSRFVLSLENDLAVRARTPEVPVKDFSSASYATIFNDEIRRRVKQVPLAFYKATPACLFSESEFPGWTFQYKDQDDASAKRQRTS